MRDRPNILMVVVDQLRFDCVGRAGQYPVRTPHIDLLADQGTWFSSAYTPIPLCCPARQALLTGRRPESLGTLWNYDLGPSVPALLPDTPTWTAQLAQAGYTSTYLGKWHVSPIHDPTHFGFAHYVSEQDHAAFIQTRYPSVAYHNGYFGEDDPIPLEDARTHWFARRAVQAMRHGSRSGSPWFVRMDLSEPHLPCRPAKPFSEMFSPDDVPVWHSFGDDFANKPYIQRQQLVNWRIEDFTWEDWAPIVARYYAIIAQVDDALGILMRALPDVDPSDNTVVVFTTDHGDMCGGHRMMDKHFVLYEDVVHVPLIVRVPGRAPRSSDDFVYNMLDLPPTLLDYVGLDIPGDMQGRSLRPLIEEGAGTDWREDVVATYNGQQFGLYSQRMLRTRDWKYIWNATDVDELYDLRADPHELRNLAGDAGQAERLARLRRTLHDRLVAQGDTLVTNQWLTDQLVNSRKLGPLAS
jgi:arylsulfatase A-like enzyme